METPDDRRQKFLPYVRCLADIYGLKDWIFQIDNQGPTSPNALASIYCPAGRRFGWIRLSQSFIDSTREEQRTMLVHELTHCHTHMEYNFAQTHLPEHHQATHNILMEYGVDAISNAIAQFFPLPE